MRLIDLVETSRRIASLSGRLEKVSEIAGLLGRTPPGQTEIAVTFLAGRLRQGRIGIGGAAVRTARPSPAEAPALDLAEVDRSFEDISRAAGPGSSREKGRLLRELLGRATREEQEFLIRLLFGELRQGALEGLMVEGVARAAGVPLAAVRRAVMAEGSIGSIAEAAMRTGEAGLLRFAVRLFQPVRPMLAQPAGSVEEAFDRMEEAALEYKLDGARVQIHKQGDLVRVFTRHLREVTAAVPELVDTARGLPAKELILDGEAIALRDDGTPLPFQVTMRRFGRKIDVDRLRLSLPLSLFLFDILYKDGQALIDLPYARRTAALGEQAGDALSVPRILGAGPAQAEEFLSRALEAGHEGIMAKAPGAAYDAGGRGFAWLKVKRAETLDLVVLAAEWGHGRRQGLLSNLHLGARDPQHGGYVMLGKTFKGLTDQTLAWQTEKLLALEIGRDAATVYVRPELVVEIAFGDVQASPRYPGGLALRFARVKRYRAEKPPDEADTIDRVRAIHEKGAGPVAGSGA